MLTDEKEIELSPIALPWDTVGANEDGDKNGDVSSLKRDTSPFSSAPTDVDAEELFGSIDARSHRHAPTSSPRPTAGGTFTIPALCLGIGMIAACLLIPAADENRRLGYERDQLHADLTQLQKQVQTNDAFLHRISTDPTLAERLALRQMKMIPAGTSTLELKSSKPSGDMSPFSLVTVPPPAPTPEYRPVGGLLANAVMHPKTQLYLIGAGMMMIACGLVMSRSSHDDELDDELV